MHDTAIGLASQKSSEVLLSEAGVAVCLESLGTFLPHVQLILTDLLGLSFPHTCDFFSRMQCQTAQRRTVLRLYPIFLSTFHKIQREPWRV